MKKRLEEGKPTPLDNRPDLYPDLGWVWNAYHDLSPSRSIGFGGVGGIPFEAIDRYAERYGVEDFEAFHRLIRAMDGAFLSHQRERQESG